jgi:hypothetical protein
MKIFTTLLMGVFCSFLSFSQEVDSRLLDRYAPEELTEMYTNNQQEYKLLVYALDNAVYLTDIPEGKNTDFETIDISGSELNFVALGLGLKETTQYFLVEGERKLLVVLSRGVLEASYSNQNK